MVPLYRSNILLDDHFSGKLSDFGFSIQLPRCYANKTLIVASTGLPGTNGYRPPEYSYSKYSILSDVYSFGVVSEPKPIAYAQNEQLILIQVVLECYTGLLAYAEDRDANNLVNFETYTVILIVIINLTQVDHTVEERNN